MYCKVDKPRQVSVTRLFTNTCCVVPPAVVANPLRQFVPLFTWSVHEVFRLLLGNNYDSASRDSDTDCAAIPFPNKGARIFSQSQSGIKILCFFHRFQPRFGRRRRSEIDRLQVDMKYSGRWRFHGLCFYFLLGLVISRASHLISSFQLAVILNLTGNFYYTVCFDNRRGLVLYLA